MKYNFERGKWKQEDFMYAYSPACKAYKEFVQEENGITNSYNDEIKDFDYISMVSRKKYKKGTVVTACCSFDSFGAPLIVICDDIDEVNGKNIYGVHYEIVAYENGINVWKIEPFYENKQRPIKTQKIGYIEFAVKEKSKTELKVGITDIGFVCRLGDKELVIECSDLPESFHTGITACEGINHFFELKIEQDL